MIAIEDTTGTWSKIVAIYPFFIFSKKLDSNGLVLDTNGTLHLTFIQ